MKLHQFARIIAMLKVEVHSRIVGTIEAENAPSNVTLDLLNEQLTDAELIAQTVEEQIHDLLIKRQLDAERAQRILNRQYLSEHDIKQQATGGVIHIPSRGKTNIPMIDPKAEIEKALEAFERKTYLLVVDGNQPQSLSEVLHFTPASKVTFLRLTPLVGG
jgi:hypothetical protein